MTLFAAFRSRRAARRAEVLFAREGFDAAAAVLDAIGGLGGGPWANFALHLYNGDHKPEAERAIRRALQLEDGRGDALIFLAELLAETEREPEAIETYRAIMRRFPTSLSSALALAKLLLRQGDFVAVRDCVSPFSHASHEAVMLLAQAHYALDDHQAVLAILGPAVARMRLELQTGTLYGGSHRDLYSEFQDASRLHDESFAALHGREKVIESALARGDLDAHAGVNYRLLGEARMARPPAWAPDSRLRSVEDGIVFGQECLARGERSRGLCHLGASRLRLGRLDEASKLFNDARDEDDQNFAAYLGLAAAMDLGAARAFDRLRVLPEPVVPALIERVVTDWAVLTGDERKVVALITSPVAGALPLIAGAGACARVLPIDARLTDLPEMQSSPMERTVDHRCLEAITGAATAEMCASKVEELLYLTGEHDSVFAHELAHLVHFHLPEPFQQRIDALYARTLEHGHVATAYQMTNAAEFFAVAYTDFIAHLYQLPSRREADEEGIVDATFALIRELAGPLTERRND